MTGFREGNDDNLGRQETVLQGRDCSHHVYEFVNSNDTIHVVHRYCITGQQLRVNKHTINSNSCRH